LSLHEAALFSYRDSLFLMSDSPPLPELLSYNLSLFFITHALCATVVLYCRVAPPPPRSSFLAVFFFPEILRLPSPSPYPQVPPILHLPPAPSFFFFSPPLSLSFGFCFSYCPHHRASSLFLWRLSIRSCLSSKVAGAPSFSDYIPPLSPLLALQAAPCMFLCFLPFVRS